MRKWLSDFLRTPWAFVYWNSRKSFYVLGGRRRVCPCQHPSDSGQPLQTGCEAAAGWNSPARFRKVCPLLTQNSRGRWVCSVTADRVRPFWGRAFAFGGVGALGLALAAGGVAIGFMRMVGYEVSMRQIFWPPAWSELRGVRAELFLDQARGYYEQGQIREMMHALGSAEAVDPDNFDTAMVRARFYKIGNPEFADVIYERLMESHPGRRAEVARAWFQNLLARNRLEQVATLARRQLAQTGGADAAVWTHALVFSALLRERVDWIETAAGDATLPLPARQTFAWVARWQRALDAATRAVVLRQTPLVEAFPYERMLRVDLLIREGLTRDALQLLTVSRGQISDRDVARLLLAAHAAAGDSARVQREFESLLAPTRALKASEVEVLALHLMRYPNAGQLAALVAALPRLDDGVLAEQVRSDLAVFCAAGIQRDQATLTLMRQRLGRTLGGEIRVLVRLEAFFLDPKLPANFAQIEPLSLEATYELAARYFKLTVSK